MKHGWVPTFDWYTGLVIVKDISKIPYFDFNKYPYDSINDNENMMQRKIEKNSNKNNELSQLLE